MGSAGGELIAGPTEAIKGGGPGPGRRFYARARGGGAPRTLQEEEETEGGLVDRGSGLVPGSWAGRGAARPEGTPPFRCRLHFLLLSGGRPGTLLLGGGTQERMMDVPFYHDEVLIALAASTAAAAAAASSEPPAAGGTSGDLAPRFASASPPSSSSSSSSTPCSSSASSSSRMKKDGLTLALSGELKPAAGEGNTGSPASSALLASPDLALLKLASPELERLIVAGAGHPLGGRFPFPAKAPRGGAGAPDEQEFAAGFGKALEDLHHQGGVGGAAAAGGPPVGGAGGGGGSGPLEPPPIYANLSPYAGGGGYAEGAPPFHAHPRLQAPPPSAKDEPQTVPEVASFGGGGLVGAGCMSSDSPPLSPIDLDTQERIKAERKRLRNRIAASKCRRRKLERISRLEEKVRHLKSQNTELASTASLLREQVAQLKQKVLSHVNSGCQLLPQAPGGAPAAAAPPPVPAY